MKEPISMPPATEMLLKLLAFFVLFASSFVVLPLRQVFPLWTTVFLAWLTYTIQFRRNRPPGPFPIPIIGNTHLFTTSGDLALPMLQLTEKYGGFVEFWITGRRFIVLSGASYLQRLATSPIYHLRGDVEELGLRELQMYHEGIVFNHDLPKWRQHKSWFLKGTSTSQALEQTVKHCLDYAHPLRTVLNACAQETTQPTNLYNVFCRYYLDVSFVGAFGAHLRCLEQPDSVLGKAFMHYFPAIRYFTTTPSLVFKYLTKKITEYHHDIVQKVLQTELQMVQNAKHEDAVEQGSEFLKFLLEKKMENPDIADEQIRSVCHEFMLGALDTALVLCNTMWHLFQCPDVSDKIRAEMAVINPDQKPWDLDLLSKLTYMEQAIYECLRLTPASPMTARMNTQDDVVDGLTIPAGATVLLNLERMHTSEEFWKNANSFNPDRFAEESEESVAKMSAKWLFSPFGGGGRGCAGKRVAIILLKSTLVSILPYFDINFRAKELKRRWESVRMPEGGADWVDIVARKQDVEVPFKGAAFVQA